MLSTEEFSFTEKPFKTITECRCCQVKNSVSLKNLYKAITEDKGIVSEQSFQE